MLKVELDTSKDQAAAIEAAKIEVFAEFVPWSQSRRNPERKAIKNAKISELGLEWRVALHVDGRPVIECEYGAGIGHAPSYKAAPTWRPTLDQDALIRFECEQGRRGVLFHGTPYPAAKRAKDGRQIMPEAEDVVYSLLMDSDAIEYRDFEDWAESFGYDIDSRKAEKIYRTCLEYGLKLRAALGDSKLAELREAFQDY